MNMLRGKRASVASASAKKAPSQTQPVPHRSSDWSDPMVPNAAWASCDFMLGAGMVIIQPATSKIVILHEKKLDYHFLPKGRKDIGESLETTALREAYEESGYKARFMPIFHRCHAPPPPSDPERRTRPNNEPIFIDLLSWGPRRSRRTGEIYDNGGEYLVTWYLGEIDADAEHEENTGMPDEQEYESILMTFEEAIPLLHPKYRMIVRYAWQVFQDTEQIWKEMQAENKEPQVAPQQTPAKVVPDIGALEL